MSNPINSDFGASIFSGTTMPATAGTYFSAKQTNPLCSGIKLVIDITVTGGSSTVFTIQGVDPVTGKTYTILASAALAAVATTVLTVFPGAPVAANVSANDYIPPTWQVQAVVTGGTGPTFTVTGAELM
jgi:hypothetical protein